MQLTVSVKEDSARYNAMRKIISVILLLAMSFQILCPAVLAAEETETYYTIEEIEQIIFNYQNNAHILSALFEKPDNLGYWKMINDMESNGFFSGAINAASKLINEDITEERCIEILSNMMIMQTGDLAEQIEKQSQFDNLKSGTDYALDVLDIATGCIGAGDILKTASPIIDAASGGTEVLIKNAEQAKYYQMAIRDYSRMYKFLDAVSQYAENETLRKAAKDLQKTNDALLEERLKYLNNTLESQIEYTAKFYLENLHFELLKQSDLYLNDETTKFFVNNGAKLFSELLKLNNLGEATFCFMIIQGDAYFGTSNTFNRYQEMKLTADIASALVKANQKRAISTDKKIQATITAIQEKCDYYRMLLSTHARGEYLIYSLLINEAGLLSEIQKREDLFKEFDETHYGKYKKQIGVITEYNEVLEKIMGTRRGETIENNLPKAIQEASQFAWDWFYTSSYTDEDDVIMADYCGEEWPYEHVNYKGVNSISEIRALTEQYYTKEITDFLMTQKGWLEYNGHLYLSRPDGLGGPSETKCEIKITKLSESKYELTLYGYYSDSVAPSYIRENINYENINGYWVFDDILLCKDASIKIIEDDMLPVYQYALLLENAVKEFLKLEAELLHYWEYATEDLNADGIDEILIQKGTCEGDKRWYVYTVTDNECVLLGSFDGWHSILYECPDSGIYNRQESSLSGTIHKITIDSNVLKEELIYEYDDGNYNAFGDVGKALVTTSITDNSLLK